MRVPVTISDGKTTEYSTALIPDSSGGKRAASPGAAAAVIDRCLTDQREWCKGFVAEDPP
jgi:hypothetical protein